MIARDDVKGISCREIVTGRLRGKWRVQFTVGGPIGSKRRLTRVFNVEAEATSYIHLLQTEGFKGASTWSSTNAEVPSVDFESEQSIRALELRIKELEAEREGLIRQNSTKLPANPDQISHHQIMESRRSDEAALRLAAIVESSEDAIIGKDLEGIITSWNPGAEKIFGYSASEMIGQSVRKLIPPERQTEENQILKQIAGGETVRHFETVRIHKDGHPIDISATVSAIRNATGKIVGASKMARDVTEEKLTRKALKASETRYRRLFETAKEGILILDAETGLIENVNPFLINLLGYTREQLIGKAIWELGPFKEIIANKKKFAELKSKGYVRYETLALETFLHEPILVELISNVYTVNDRSVIQCNIRDVTSKMLTEKVLRETEQRMRLATEASEVGIWEWNVVTGKIRWDKQMFHLYGVEPSIDGFVEYSTWRNAVHPEDLQEQEELLQETVRSKRQSKREFRVIRSSDGECRYVEAVETVRTNDEGQAEWVVGTNLDITDRKHSELALQEGEERFRTMANSMPQLAWIAHADGELHWFNRRWYEYTETTPEQMENLGWRRVHDPRVLDMIVGRWQDALAKQIPFEMEFPLLSADGEFRMFLTRVEPLRNSNGEVMQWFGTNTDIHEIKRAEAEVHQLNASLEQRVADRTKELEAANQELEAFSYSISHDLRSPLRAMDGFSHAVLEDYGHLLPQDGHRCLETIRKSAQKMGNLIDDLLSFSYLSRAPLTLKEVDMNRLVQSVVDELLILEKNRMFDTRISDLPACQGDPSLLKQVWTNLISNAFKYSGKEPHPVIEIGFGGNGDHPTYFIKDNGTGFDMRYSSKLFSVFQRFHRAEDFDGTGVGLAIVHRIISRHGGTIWADAAVGQGATFYFTLLGEIEHEQH